MKLIAFFRSQTFSGALSIGKINEENNKRDHDECGKYQLHVVLLSCSVCERDEKALWNEQDFFLSLLFLLCLCFQKMQERRKVSKKEQKQKIVKSFLSHGFCFFLQGTCLIKARNEAFLVYPLLA